VRGVGHELPHPLLARDPSRELRLDGTEQGVNRLGHLPGLGVDLGWCDRDAPIQAGAFRRQLRRDFTRGTGDSAQWAQAEPDPVGGGEQREGQNADPDGKLDDQQSMQGVLNLGPRQASDDDQAVRRLARGDPNVGAVYRGDILAAIDVVEDSTDARVAQRQEEVVTAALYGPDYGLAVGCIDGDPLRLRIVVRTSKTEVTGDRGPAAARVKGYALIDHGRVVVRKRA
jgi:hypothetical protein